ncbi:MAG: aldehyde dehydrogenase family protein [Acidimicrobiales bacterium]
MAARALTHSVGDRWLTGEPRELLTILSPFTGEPVAHVPVAGKAEVSAAVAAAAEASTPWRASSPGRTRGLSPRRRCTRCCCG